MELLQFITLVVEVVIVKTLQVLQLLQGEVYDRESVPVLDAMREYIAAVEETEGHLLKPQLDLSVPVAEA